MKYCIILYHSFPLSTYWLCFFLLDGANWTITEQITPSPEFTIQI